MVDPGEDFSGYMENLAASEAADQQHQAMLDDHELWRQTSWGGWAVRQVQSASGHFRPFVDQVTAVMRDDDSLIKVIVFSGLRIIVIMAVVCFIFAFAKLLQYIIGREIVQEEEIVIVHEFASEEEAREARANKKSRKSKKSKSQ